MKSRSTIVRRRLTGLASCLIVTAVLGFSATDAIATTADAHAVTLSPDGARLYAGQTGANFSILSRNGSTGLFGPLSVTAFGETGGGLCICQAIAPSSDGHEVYSIGNDELHVSAVTPAALETVESFRHNVGGVSGLAAGRSVALSPDGRSVYVTSENKQIAVFSRDPATGRLTFLEAPVLAGYPGSIAISPIAGAFLYLEDNSSNGRSIDIFERSPTSGRLSFVESPEAPLGRLSISPDGNFLYVASEERITAFSRNEASGALTQVGQTVNGSGGVVGMKAIGDAAISPDGENLYATSGSENALVTFRRNQATGLLTYVGTLFDGNGGVDGLSNAAQVIVSADGSSVLVAAAHDNGVGVFARESPAASPRFVQLVVDSTFPGTASPIVTGPSPVAGGAGGAPADLVFRGNEGVSVDRGARYTDDPDVALKIVAPANATGVRISNDGGFATAKRFDASTGGSYPWTLDSSGPERLPKTVYVRFEGPAGQSALTFTDDIILDETPPTIEEASLVEPDTAGTAADRPQKASAELVLRARDRTSGVAEIQVTTKKSKPGPLLPYRAKTPVKSAAAPVFVRVRDKAGNFTKWRRVGAPARSRDGR